MLAGQLPSQLDLRWSRIAAYVLLLIGAMGAVLASRLSALQDVTAIVPSNTAIAEDDFVLTPAFAAENDIPVLRLALARLCGDKEGITLLSNRPFRRLEKRPRPPTEAIPEELACPGIRVVPDQEIVSSNPKALRVRFHGLARIKRASLPIYTWDGSYANVFIDDLTDCFDCSPSGIDVYMQKIHGQWVVTRVIGPPIP